MSNSPSAERTELIEQLSAYIDGELDAEARQQIEQRLLADERTRDVLRQLEQANALLDELPRSDVEPSFTETTVSMIALAEAQEPSRRLWQHSRWLVWTLRGGGLLIALACGFGVVAAVRPAPNEILLRDLPVIENLEPYRHAGSIEFLRRLKARKLFAGPESGDGR
ncbi:MAG TPA: zf-HC2 domain-containing protein [Pirellulales bacterium]|jgi:anti-sigma factor RsiW|nr:zf-HC2 domain-containing protein [Pirellulales bacterium]